MRAGNLRNRITIQQSTPSQDTFGEPILTWATYTRPWAEIKHGSGSEPYSGDQYAAISNVEFKIRYDAGVNERMRISWDSRLFDIIHIDPVFERKRKTVLTCRQVNND
jgi:SPP1 family predicted phage head-tail adaptor